ncbi:hypothetical protein FA95DRAFT_1558958 [Auriscalpium vulgare]|uniref:Uncharacterized protein n=1 Tax=Auriscalpium vulgare TaxID=40419 RepID=A0ACB8RVJ5_9AGAM|nr:hypothetical protein FA95DRAFT_1558958 [Auriscalpium vulgare]
MFSGTNSSAPPAAALSSASCTPESGVTAALFLCNTAIFNYVVPVWVGYRLTLLTSRRYRQPWVDGCIVIAPFAVYLATAGIALHLILNGPRGFVTYTLLIFVTNVICGMGLAILVNSVRDLHENRAKSGLASVSSLGKDGGAHDKEIDVAEKGGAGEPSVSDTAGEAA